jgi:hypothetical protein
MLHTDMARKGSTELLAGCLCRESLPLADGRCFGLNVLQKFTHAMPSNASGSVSSFSQLDLSSQSNHPRRLWPETLSSAHGIMIHAQENWTLPQPAASWEQEQVRPLFYFQP